MRRRGRGARQLPSLEPPRRLERKYAAFFRQYTDLLEELTQQVLDKLPSIVADGDIELGRPTRTDAQADESWDLDPYWDPETGGPWYADLLPELAGLEGEPELDGDQAVTVRLDAARKLRTVEQVIDGLRVQYERALFNTELEADEFVNELSDEAVEVNRAQFRRHMIAQGEASPVLSAAAVKFAVDESPGIPSSLRQRFIRRGLSLIVDKGSPRVPPIPTQHFKALRKIVENGIRDGLRVESIRDKIKHLNGVSQRRAETIARDQIGKYHGGMMQTRQRQLGITGYTWTTVGDERVRESHEGRDGKHFEWSDPPTDGHPGQPVNCRCSAVPDLEGALSRLEAS